MVNRHNVRLWLLRMGMVVGVVGLAVYLLTPFATLRYDGPIYSAQLGRGAIAMFWQSTPRFQPPIAPPGLNPGQPVLAPFPRSFTTDGKRLPLYFKPTVIDVGEDQRTGRIVVPAWLLVLVGVFCFYLRLPAEVAPGFCPRCGFDIRSAPPLPDAPSRIRCPECGHVSRRNYGIEKGGAEAPP